MGSVTSEVQRKQRKSNLHVLKIAFRKIYTNISKERKCHWVQAWLFIRLQVQYSDSGIVIVCLVPGRQATARNSNDMLDY